MTDEMREMIEEKNSAGSTPTKDLPNAIVDSRDTVAELKNSIASLL